MKTKKTRYRKKRKTRTKRRYRKKKSRQRGGTLIPDRTTHVKGIKGTPAKLLRGELYEAAYRTRQRGRKITMEGPPMDLPEGWEYGWDEKKGKYYFVNSSTRESTWQNPNLMAINDLEYFNWHKHPERKSPTGRSRGAFRGAEPG
jgi:hypothetical protein